MSLKKLSLKKRGYKSFEDWNSDPNHEYIGRNMSRHVAGALGSKWGNPYKPKKGNKNSLKRCLERYENHIRRNPRLFNAVMELEGKELGCWCKPSPCHGDILIKLFRERQGILSYPSCSMSNIPSISSPLRLTGGGSGCTSDCQEDDEVGFQGDGLFVNIPSICSTPLGGENIPECEDVTSDDAIAQGNKILSFVNHESQGNLDNTEFQSSSIFVNNPPISSQSSQNSQYVLNENDPESANRVDSMLEQDIRGILLETGYTIEEISDIISQDRCNESACSEEPSFVDGNMSLLDDIEDPFAILKDLKEKNSERPVIAHLNINSLSPKFEPLTEMVKDSIDFLLVTESKLDDTFPMGQFQIEGFSRPIRLDRNRNGGGLIVFTRDDLTCRELKPRVLYPELECTFLEMRIRHNKWLVLVGYNPQKENISYFLEKVSFEVDKLLPKYDNLLMLGDWNSAVTEECMSHFCDMYELENLIKEPTCFKSTGNPSSIDVILTNKKSKFQNSMTVETGLSDFHKMTVTVMKNHFKKKEPIRIVYHDKSKFDAVRFREKIKYKIERKGNMSLDELQNMIVSDYVQDAPLKEKVLRGNNAPFMNRTLSQAFSTRARLKNKKQKCPTQENEALYRKQRNYCVSLLRKEKKTHYNNIDLSSLKDQKRFYEIVKPKFTGKSKVKEKITLIEKEELIADEGKIAEIMNNYFVDAVSNLGIKKSGCVEVVGRSVKTIEQKIDAILESYKSHPSIVMIKSKVTVTTKFKFKDTNADEMYRKMILLDSKKSNPRR